MQITKKQNTSQKKPVKVITLANRSMRLFGVLNNEIEASTAIQRLICKANTDAQLLIVFTFLSSSSSFFQLHHSATHLNCVSSWIFRPAVSKTHHPAKQFLHRYTAANVQLPIYVAPGRCVKLHEMVLFFYIGYIHMWPGSATRLVRRYWTVTTTEQQRSAEFLYFYLLSSTRQGPQDTSFTTIAPRLRGRLKIGELALSLPHYTHIHTFSDTHYTCGRRSVLLRRQCNEYVFPVLLMTSRLHLMTET